ncbi:MAG: hypothetical protein GX045_05080 [Clostridiaceae bacterium]|jgi:hypothetical protein|nr:hypothetical protein [Clostridiaceae bacterium]
MKKRKIKLSEKDLRIIDTYSKKNLSETMPQFGNQVDNMMVQMQGKSSMHSGNKTDIYD